MRLDEIDLRAIAVAIADELENRKSRAVSLPDGRIGFLEPEAAALIGVAPHVLRDCRLRGEISGRKVGNKIVYHRDELSRFLLDRK
jgi:hypothetical protein